MTDLMRLSPFTGSGLVRVVIETPGNARLKIKYEPRLRVFAYDRPLPAGLTYPYDWGFVPATVGEDGDPLDGMVLHHDVTFPGTVFECRLLGVLQVEQTERNKTIRNDRYFFCPAQTGIAEEMKERCDLSARDRRDLEQFFRSAVVDTGKKLKRLEWHSEDTGMTGLRRGASAFSRRRKK